MDWKNKLCFGDNLPMLRARVQDASVDLIYLDPPFNSNASYNVLFKKKSGEESAAQITAFEDIWQWGLESEAVSSYADLDGVYSGRPEQELDRWIGIHGAIDCGIDWVSNQGSQFTSERFTGELETQGSRSAWTGGDAWTTSSSSGCGAP